MNNQKRTLTPEQESLIPIYVNNWEKITLSTEEIDCLKAWEAVKAIYNILELPEPDIYFFDSPVKMAKAAAKEVKRQVNNLIYPRVIDRLIFFLHQTIFHPILQAYESKKKDYLYFIDRCINLDRLVIRRDSDRNVILGIVVEGLYIFASAFKTDYIGEEEIFIDYCLNVLDLNVPEDIKRKWQIYKSFIESCGLIFPSEDECLICNRPKKISFDSENRIHAVGEAAIQYRDGFSIYANSGVRLPEKYGKIHPKEWQPQWLLTEENAELRRVLIQNIGYEKICQELAATTLNTWREYELIKIDKDLDIEQINLLKMTCPSTNRIHILRVPPYIKTAREAITWRNWDIDPEEFTIET
ncbi:MAG: hypothetical protein QNJ38_07220 [Prochloraceae cyanobacterium]|nr:hypothetical protein [Prochloraceae cyanobacterium]